MAAVVLMTFLLWPHSTNGFCLRPHSLRTIAAHCFYVATYVYYTLQYVLRKTTGASMQHYGTSSVEQVMICTVPVLPA